MKKVACVFVLAVFAPSLVLAWLAVRSAHDQQIVVAQQQTLLYQGVADALAKDVRDFMSEHQREFAQTVEALRRDHTGPELADHFDDLLRQRWPHAEVGFSVTIGGSVLSPSLFGRAEARQFRLNNDRFLCSSEPVQVYWNSPKGAINLSKLDAKSASGSSEPLLPKKDPPPGAQPNKKFALVREPADTTSKITPEDAEFKELVGNSFAGTVARFLQNRLKVLLWYRSLREPDMIYGAQLNLTNITADLQSLIRPPERVREDVAVVLLNDGDKVVAGGGLATKPFVTSEIGYVLPHWKIALALLHPESLSHSARTLRLTLTLIVILMIAAIVVGSVLIAADVKRQLALARQKTDFVSNVSHELKTPLTSIRMFTELLREGKIADDARQKHFLQIIGSETARLTRLIDNVLDFASLERGGKKFDLVRCDLKCIVQKIVESYRPQLEAEGFKVMMTLPEGPVEVKGDSDALAQVLVNLISNAEKYAASGKEITVELGTRTTERRPPSRHAGIARADHPEPETCARVVEVQVLDRGPGVPPGSEEKIFEQFYRAHDSLSSGIPGSGLGLTLARQIARKHGGDVRYETRDDGGSCFVVALPAAG